MGRRRFVKKGEEVRHFKLVARPQSEIEDDEDESPLVLEPYVPPGAQRKTGKTEAELLTIPESLEHLGSAIYGNADDRNHEPSSSCTEPKKRVADDAEDYDGWGDLDGDCYFPPDGYNYEQHLKRVSGTGKKKSVVGVVMDTPVPLDLKEVFIQPAANDDEMEVLRALEHAEEYEELEDGEIDDLIPGGVIQPELVLWGPSIEQTHDLPDMAIFKEHKAMMAAMKRDGLLEDDDDEFDDGLDEFDEEPSGNAVTTSSKLKGKGVGAVAPRNEEFDDFLADEYADDEIGSCGEDDVGGHLDLENCEDLLDEYLAEQKAEEQELFSLYEPQKGIKDDEPRVIAETKAIIERYYLQEESDEENTSEGENSIDESRTWDCESVLSTLSNISNRPGKIGKIKIIKKPLELKSVKEQDAGEDEDDEEDKDVVELPDVITERKRGETPEERKARKASVKELRRVCRKMKKESKEMYKAEAAKLPGQTGGADLKQKLRVVKF